VSSAAREARLTLWEWIDDDDPEYVAGMIDACERTGVLDPDEIAAWRALLAGGSVPAAPGDAARAKSHLRALLADQPPLSRNPTPEGLSASWRLIGALEALSGTGLLSEAEHAEWHVESLRAQAPWLEAGEVDEIAGMEGFVAIAVPPESPEEEAQDQEWRERLERMSVTGEIVRVLVPRRISRHEGMAIVALVVRTESVEVHFHAVGPAGDISADLAYIEAMRSRTHRLVAPVLTDDAGTAYEAAGFGPVHASGGASVTTGVWRYHPAPPPEATRFTVGQTTFSV
jgi:hypothetical protein